MTEHAVRLFERAATRTARVLPMRNQQSVQPLISSLLRTSWESLTLGRRVGAPTVLELVRCATRRAVHWQCWLVNLDAEAG